METPLTVYDTVNLTIHSGFMCSCKSEKSVSCPAYCLLPILDYSMGYVSLTVVVPTESQFHIDETIW